jgi:pyruvate dehydrogenase E2 component (dihydrolipoamide acetyltransferase)
MGEFRMPSLGADMEAGTLVEWLKRPGDRVKRGDIVAVVETQKGAIEVDIFEDGVIERWLVEPGTTVPVGTPLALIADGGPTAAAAPSKAPAAGAVPAPPALPRVEPPPRVELPPAVGRAKASPAARRLARERGIALAGLIGSGPGGAILYARRRACGSSGGAPPGRAETSRLWRNAPGDRRGHGALEARDPALLSEHGG